MFLGKVSAPMAQEYFDKRHIAVIPVGACESHGSHMALGTDYLIPTKICEMVEERTDVLVVPMVPYGVSDHHNGFNGTISIGYEGLLLVLRAIAESLYKAGIRRFVFINGHGGNTPAISRVCLELNQREDKAHALLLNWWTLAGKLNPAWAGGHGAGQETSGLMFAAPDAVHMERFKETTLTPINKNFEVGGPGTVILDGIAIDAPRDMREMTSDGWFGADHPLTANVEWGKEMIEAVVDFCVKAIEAFEE